MVIPPPVAVTVRVNVPGAVDESAESVSALLPPPGAGMLVRAQVAETPLGSPETVNPIAELKPAAAVVVNVTIADPPGARGMLVRFDDRLKMGRTFSVNVCVLVSPPPVATTVSV